MTTNEKQLTETRPGVQCGACDHWASERGGEVAFYLPQGEIAANVWKCTHCGTYIQDADFEDPAIQAHFDVASYTAPDQEERWRTLRTEFFRWIIDRSRTHLGQPLAGRRALDIGIAYGIMMDLLREQGAEAEGVEIVASLRDAIRKRGFTVHEGLDQVVGSQYDLVYTIDSFYYLHEPATALRKIRDLMSPSGVLTMRLANRAWFFDLVRKLGKEVSAKRFGDLKYFYTERGACLLLERTGFQVDRIYWNDRGRRDPRTAESIFYKLSPLANYVLPVKISPGMLIVARPRSGAQEKS